MSIYSTPSGPALKVRTETRYGDEDPQHLFVLAQDRLVITRWEAEIPESFELIHDPAATVEVELAEVETRALLNEREILFDCMAAALGMLDERSADQVRDIYRSRIQQADIVSLTKAKELI